MREINQNIVDFHLSVEWNLLGASLDSWAFKGGEVFAVEAKCELLIYHLKLEV